MAKFTETVRVRLADGSVVEAKATACKGSCLAIVNGRFKRVTRKKHAKVYNVA